MIEIDGSNLKIEDVISVARDFEEVRLAKGVEERVKRSREVIEEIIDEGKVVYGVSTGFGELAKIKISKEDVEKLQENLIRSHSCGAGENLPTEIVRAMMLLRANSLAKGYSGVRLETIKMLLDMLNKKVHPTVPEKGSLGASGDLIPLSHIALTMMGEGKVEVDGKVLDSIEGLKRKGLKPIKFKAKEGLALINGTQLLSAYLCISVYDLEVLLKNAQIAGVMSLEALRGTDQAFREEIHKLRPYSGQLKAAKNLWSLTRDSEIIKSHKNCPKVQDAYTLRCMPQVFGAIYDSLDFARKIAEIEINSVTDNPIVIPEKKEVLSGGNFHGQPLALVMDMLAISAATLGSFSERRIARLVDEKLSELPPFLVKDSGLNSGFMMPHYLAASLVNENKILAHPASCDSIPVSANQEDFVSMGATSGRKLMKIIDNVQYIIAIEFLAASQALEFLKPLKPSPAIQLAYDLIRKNIPKLDVDRSMKKDIELVKSLIKKGTIVKEVEKEIKIL